MVGCVANITALSSYSCMLLTTISSPQLGAWHSDIATRVAIFSSGRVTMGSPAHKTSVPVVCALQRGLQQREVPEGVALKLGLTIHDYVCS
jgi:hypothetical protein